jgi:methylmalonyl-CoA mutase, N-terminal domain
VRTTISALAAVLGGTQSLHTNSRDEALSLPSEASARIALRTQQIIAQESGVTRTIDPLAGSYVIEWLTDEIEGRALTIIENVDGRGGAVAAIKAGLVQREIESSAYHFQRRVDSGERKIVGVEAGREPDPVTAGGYQFNPQWETEQVGRLGELRGRRDAATIERALARVTATARTSENLVPSVIEAVRAYATIGEITRALEAVFGRHRE